MFEFLQLALLFVLSLIIFHKLSKSSKPYPIIGHLIPFYTQKDHFQWITSLILSSPTFTFVLYRPFGGGRLIFTANPAIVEHILKTQFAVYQKGPYQKTGLEDLLGDGIFNVDGDTWKIQRQISSHEFNTKSLRKFVETVVDSELDGRLLPLLGKYAKEQNTLDLQDILQRFAFDNICKIAFGYDPEYLSPDLPQAKFAVFFEDAVTITAERFRTFLPFVWKLRRFFNVGSEKRLRKAVVEVREFATSIVRKKTKEIQEKKKNKENLDSDLDLLSRFLISGYSDERFVTDIVISFILAGRDTTSAALTWFFWLVYRHPSVEEEILKEITVKTKDSVNSVYNEVKEMVYTHAAICETMRLYPPVPADTKQAMADDVFPDGTFVKKGWRVTYHPYAMGRSPAIWGTDWASFQPERWLEKEDGKWRFVGRDPYSYAVFQAGPRVCLGKEMAFLQMKRVVAGILRQFKVVPAVDDGGKPVFLPALTAKMKGGFPVRFHEREI